MRSARSGSSVATIGAIMAGQGAPARASPRSTTARAAAKKKTPTGKPMSRKAKVPTAGKALEDMTRAELYAVATEADVQGRKNMKKDELIAGIRAVRPDA